MEPRQASFSTRAGSDRTLRVSVAQGQVLVVSARASIPGCDNLNPSIRIEACECPDDLALTVFDGDGEIVDPSQCVVPGTYTVRAQGGAQVLVHPPLVAFFVAFGFLIFGILPAAFGLATCVSPLAVIFLWLVTAFLDGLVLFLPLFCGFNPFAPAGLAFMRLRRPAAQRKPLGRSTQDEAVGDAGANRRGTGLGPTAKADTRKRDRGCRCGGA